MKITLTTVGVVTVTCAVLAGCGGGGARVAATPSSASASPTSASPTEDLNVAACDAAHDTMLKVQNAMSGWDTSTDLFNKTVAAKLRTSATELFSEEVQATGSVKDAIHAEADGLVKLSVAMEASDAGATSAAADAGNVALAELRGVCKF